MPNSVTVAAASFEILLLLAGLVLLWRLVLSPAARKDHPPPALQPWNVSIETMLWFAFLIIAGWLLLAALAGGICRVLDVQGIAAKMIIGGAAQLGWLAGVLLHQRLFEPRARSDAPRQRPFVGAGVATFLLALPVVTLSGLAWRKFLELTGLDSEAQELIGIFARLDSPALMALMVTLAVIIAPMTEELVFRGGLFRYARTRVSRGFALVGPALIFAAFHQNLASLVPLTVLAIMLSLAYERTGHIGTPIVAHALFNLNTIVLIFAGVASVS